MEIFEPVKGVKIVCDSHNTRRGFKHVANLFIDGVNVSEETAHYLNRTWEAYTYQSVMLSLVQDNPHLSMIQHQKAIRKLKGRVW